MKSGFVPSRRSFLKTTAVMAPAILGADDKAGTKLPVVGSGAHTYEVQHDWGELPRNIAYGNTHGVVEDSQGRIYVHHTVHSTSESFDSMVVFDAKGKFIKSWGKDFKGGAHGLHIRKEGSTEFLYLCDTKRAVVVMILFRCVALRVPVMTPRSTRPTKPSLSSSVWTPRSRWSASSSSTALGTAPIPA